MSFSKAEPFSASSLAADLRTVARVLADCLASVSDTDWGRLTEPDGWTVGETVSHLAAVATDMLQALEASLAGRPVLTDGLNSRYDLAAYNTAAIAARRDQPAGQTIEELLLALEQSAKRAAALSEAELSQPVPLRAYNRPSSVAEVLGNEIIHPGITHAAQLANGLGLKPLWTGYEPAFLQRCLTRFLHVVSHSYWPERGGDLVATVNYVVAGPAGGSWHLLMNPNGGDVGLGRAKRPSLTLRFSSADIFCQVFTLQLSPWRAFLTGRVLAWGNVPLAFRLSELYVPT